MTTFIFDIETVPDLEMGRTLYGLAGLSDADVLAAMNKMRREAVGSEFQRHHLHQVVCISMVMRTEESFAIWSLGDAQSSEAVLLQQFFSGVAKYEPQLVSWNGSGFDLPVMHYRGLKHGVNASQYWEHGDTDRDYKYDNYLSRYHWRHLDLMDVLAGFSPRASAPLDEVAQMMGLPGKMGIGGAKVAETYLNGGIDEIRHYCEIDVLNTYLVFLRFQLMTGKLTREFYQQEQEYVRQSLQAMSDRNPYFVEYLAAWSENTA